METLTEMIAAWLIGVAPSTRVTYRATLTRWLRWCADNNINALHVNRSHIEVFTLTGEDMERVAKRSVYTRRSIICGFYRYLFEEGVIDSDPGEHVRRPRLYGHSDGTCLTRGQAADFLAEAHVMDARTDALCSLLLLTGARIGEALGLDVEDCHLDGERPWVRFHRKGDWSQRVAVPSEAAGALAGLIGRRRRGPVFRGPSGARMRHQTAVGLVSSVALRIGVPGISPHSLRRTFCTLSRDAGVPDRDIMAAGGWSSPHMLDYYDMSRRGLDGAAGDGLQDFLSEERKRRNGTEDDAGGDGAVAAGSLPRDRKQHREQGVGMGGVGGFPASEVGEEPAHHEPGNGEAPGGRPGAVPG